MSIAELLSTTNSFSLFQSVRLFHETYENNALYQKQYRQFYETLNIALTLYKTHSAPPTLNETHSAYFADSSDSESHENSTVKAFPVPLTSASRDWNTEFQTILTRINDDTILTFYKEFTALSQLTNDFIFVAKTIGRIIISEKHIADCDKTIPPHETLGGVAGGVKYVAHNIIFKFAVDTYDLYGSDHNASKAAGHELLGISHVNMCHVQGLCTPLCCVIDYRGFRLIAMSMLPISEQTLVYGSADMGRKVKNTDERLRKKMDSMAEELHLAPHSICNHQGEEMEFKISVGFDVEGHLGEDGRYYVVDCARLFPSMPFENSREKRVHGNPHLYQLFRPELLRSLDFNLSSDAFSSLSGSDSTLQINKAKKAYGILKKERIPLFLSFIEKKSLLPSLPGRTLTSLLHQHGINVRFLGLVRKIASSQVTKAYLLTELTARAIKNILRSEWREKMTKVHFLSNEIFKLITIEILNLTFSKTIQGTTFWNTKVKPALQDSYTSSLSSREVLPSFDMHGYFLAHNCMKRLLDRVIEMTGISLVPSVVERADFTAREVFNISHIISVDEKVKSMPTSHYALGTLLFILSKKALESGRFEEATRLGRLALQQYNSVLLYNLNHHQTLCNYSYLIHRIFNRKNKAMSLLQRAVRIAPRHVRSWYYLSLYHRKDKQKEFVLKALELSNYTHVNALKSYGYIMLNQRNYEKAEFYFRECVRLCPSSVRGNIALADFLSHRSHIKTGDDILTLYGRAAGSKNGDHASRVRARLMFVSLMAARAEFFFNQSQYFLALYSASISARLDPENLFRLSLVVTIISETGLSPLSMTHTLQGLEINAMYEVLIQLGKKQLPDNPVFILMYCYFLKTQSNEGNRRIKFWLQIAENMCIDAEAYAGVSIAYFRVAEDTDKGTEIYQMLKDKKLMSRKILSIFQRFTPSIVYSTADKIVHAPARINPVKNVTPAHICWRRIQGFPCWCTTFSKLNMYLCTKVPNAFNSDRQGEVEKLVTHMIHRMEKDQSIYSTQGSTIKDKKMDTTITDRESRMILDILTLDEG